MKIPKLKPCPFCGAPAVMQDWAAIGEYWVACTECEMRTAEHHDPKIAALVWNRRAEVKSGANAD